MRISALWSSLFDPDLELDEARRARVLARARQTFGVWQSRRTSGVFFHTDRRRPRLGAVLLFAGFLLLLMLIASRSYGLAPMTFVVFLMGAEAIGGFPVVEWLCRPAMIHHVRRAVLDLGYDEVCWRCGYRLKSLPREKLQCPECGAVRERPREIPEWQLTALDEIAPDVNGSRGTMHHHE